MGCDGGTIPKRDELVRTKKKKEEKDKQSELQYRWGHCSITQQPLQKPIVACQLGRLYNKVAVIEAILDKTKLPDTSNHIKSIKDVKELNLTDNSYFKSKAKTSEAYDESSAAPYVCPVIGLEMNGKFRFIFLWSCGCVLSERALKAVPGTQCHKCQHSYTEEDVIILNGNEEDLAAANKRMEDRKAKAKLAKKGEKKDKTKEKMSDSIALPSTSSGITKPNGTAKRPATVDLSDPLFKKTKAEYSIAKDPSASGVYKSLFTSHDTARKQEKAHWVTYNPFYN